MQVPRIVNSMKKVLFIFYCIFNTACYAQEHNLDVVNRLKKDNFYLEFYELAFCINEIHFILENDTSYFNVWKNRIENFSKHELSYLKKIGCQFFSDMQNNNPDNQYYSRAVKFVQDNQLKIGIEKPVNFAQDFRRFIEYPEQVDDACLIMLICNIDCYYFIEIQNDEIALWRFNQWLEYGFEEFRYNYSLLDKSRRMITNRIIDYIVNKNDCEDKDLVRKSKKMIKSVMFNSK